MQGIQRVSGVVRLIGDQFVYKLNSKKHHQLTALLSNDDLKGHEEEREQLIKLLISQKYENRKKVTETWDWSKDQVGDDHWRIKFSWPEERPMPIWDSAGNKLSEPVRLNGGAKVKIAFQQEAWGEDLVATGRERGWASPRHGARFILRGIQVIKESSLTEEWDEDNIREMFGVHPGGFINKNAPTAVEKPKVVSIKKQDIQGLGNPRRIEWPKKFRS